MAEWDIPPIKIGDLEFKLMQGGMGVGISRAGLASAVANNGGAGIIAAVGLSAIREENYQGSYAERNQQALRDEIREARRMTSGVIGVNIMCALTDHKDLMETALQENVDLIASGAGIPRTLPLLKQKYPECKTKLIPIVASAGYADLICRLWIRHYNYAPDAIVVEGREAGGHLGFDADELVDSAFSLENIIPKVVKAIHPYGNIPVIAAGGLYYGGDIKKFRALGVTGGQMATRFVTTHECNAPPVFKQAYLNCEKKDITIIRSPVHMLGRALINQFLIDVEKGIKIPTDCKYQCLTPCNPLDSPYCIARALVETYKGNLDKGFVFCGSNAWRTKEDGIIPVKELFEKINQEYRDGRVSD